MVAGGVTSVLPEAAVTDPTPLSIEALVAPVVTQLSVLDPPTVIVDGEAVKESIRHGEPGQLIVVGEEYAFVEPRYALIRYANDNAVAAFERETIVLPSAGSSLT